MVASQFDLSIPERNSGHIEQWVKQNDRLCRGAAYWDGVLEVSPSELGHRASDTAHDAQLVQLRA